MGIRSSPASVLLQGPGEMRQRCREFDWAATPLGSVETWPPELRAAATIVLASGFPSILLWDGDLTQLYNDAYIPFLGVKHPRALGMPTFECWPEVRHIVEPIFERALAGETVTIEEQFYSLQNAGSDKPPQDVYITNTFTPVGALDAVCGVLVTLVDVSSQVAARNLLAERAVLITQLELERTRLTSVFQNAPNFIAMLRGPDQTYAFINEAYSQIIGHRDVVGKALLDALPEVRGQGFKELLDQVRESGEPWIGRESPVGLQRTPGAPIETRYLDMVFQAFVEADGTRSGVVAHGSDVTDHVLARQELLAANEQLQASALELEVQADELRDQNAIRERVAEAEAANQAKIEFLSTMSHELRTPLNAIGGYAELLEMGVHGPVTTEQREALERIKKSQRHLLGLINGILNYAKVDTGAVTYAHDRVLVADVLTNCDALIAPLMRSKGLEFQNGRCEPDAAVQGDSEKIQQVLFNLLSNAAKFTAPGGVIAIECEFHRDVTTLTVRDTGYGIPADKLDRVFDPFVQLDSKLTRIEQGVGLGLAISRDLARGMGGDLRVESALGVGSRFILSLPSATGS